MIKNGKRVAAKEDCPLLAVNELHQLLLTAFYTWEFEEKFGTEAVTDVQECQINEELIRKALNHLPD